MCLSLSFCMAKNLLKTSLHKTMLIVLLIIFEITTTLKGKSVGKEGGKAGMERVRRQGRKGAPVLRMQILSPKTLILGLSCTLCTAALTGSLSRVVQITLGPLT